MRRDNSSESVLNAGSITPTSSPISDSSPQIHISPGNSYKSPLYAPSPALTPTNAMSYQYPPYVNPSNNVVNRASLQELTLSTIPDKYSITKNVLHSDYHTV